MNGIPAKTWNLMPFEEKERIREEYASQFNKSKYATCLVVRRRKGEAFVWVRLRPSSK